MCGPKQHTHSPNYKEKITIRFIRSKYYPFSIRRFECVRSRKRDNSRVAKRQETHTTAIHGQFVNKCNHVNIFIAFYYRAIHVRFAITTPTACRERFYVMLIFNFAVCMYCCRLQLRPIVYTPFLHKKNKCSSCNPLPTARYTSSRTLTYDDKLNLFSFSCNKNVFIFMYRPKRALALVFYDMHLRHLCVVYI